MSDRKLQVIPLGGLGEFGMNSMALRYGDDIIVVDAGMMFPDDEIARHRHRHSRFRLPPREPRARPRADHHAWSRGPHRRHPISPLEFERSGLLDEFTLALIERRLEEHDLLKEARLNAVTPGQKLELGPFKIEFIHVTHSIVSAMCLAITTPMGVVIHSGDFKVDPTPTDNKLFDLHTLADYGRRGVLLLLSDSTNSDRPASLKANAPCARVSRRS